MNLLKYQMAKSFGVGYLKVIGSSPLGGTGVFTYLLTPGSCRISRDTRKLARTSTIIKILETVIGSK